MNPRFQRLGEADRAAVHVQVDGRTVQALAGDTVMVALLTHGRSLRQSEFDESSRSGFCLMGACQDCWVWTAGGERLRACSTPVADGMHLLTRAPEAPWNLL